MRLELANDLERSNRTYRKSERDLLKHPNHMADKNE